MLDIRIERTKTPKAKPADESKLGFGQIFTDHMFLMDYTKGEGWHDPRIVPYQPFSLDPATVVMGTMSKALGTSGGYVACARLVRDYLLNKAGGFIFSTAPSPLVVAAGLRAWELLPSLDAERKGLLARAESLRANLRKLGFDPGQSTTHIVPVIMGTPERTVAAKDALAAKGILVSAVRPPTVPQGTSRLRLGLSASHTDEDLARLLEALGSL